MSRGLMLAAISTALFATPVAALAQPAPAPAPPATAPPGPSAPAPPGPQPVVPAQAGSWIQPVTPMSPPPGTPFAAPGEGWTPPWQPGSPVPAGYRIRYERSNAMMIGGGATLAFSYTVTTLIASGIAATGFPGIFIGPIGSIPLVGPYPMAALAALNNAGVGTTAALIALGAVQAVGFGILVRGIVAKTPVGLVRSCDDESAGLTVSPLVSPQAGGISISGSL